MSSTLTYCRCGHVRSTHFNGSHLFHLKAYEGGEFVEERFRCHTNGCHCHMFTEDTRLWSKIKRKIGKR